MNILIRVDASFEIGSGHVMRCLTLAEELRKYGHRIIFITRNIEGNLSNLIRNKFDEVFLLESRPEVNLDDVYHANWLGVCWKTDATQTIDVIKNLKVEIDWMIIDHYSLDVKWENMIRNYVNKLFVIDDLADREHFCDVLLDQNFYIDKEQRYNNLVSDKTIKLFGPEYALLRDEFVQEKTRMLEKLKSNKRNNILVFFGGSDPTEETIKVISLLKDVVSDENKVYVVVGENNKQKERIRNFCENNENFSFHCQIDYLAQLISECKFAICAGGSFTWERYSLGLPAILIAVAHNQNEIIQNILSLKVDTYVGLSGQYHISKLKEIIFAMVEDKERKLELKGKYSMELVDGRGKNRVLKVMEQLN